MTVIDDCTGLDLASINGPGPFCSLGMAETGGLEFASIGEAGPFYGMVSGGGGPPAPVGALSRIYPGITRVYPGVVRKFPV